MRDVEIGLCWGTIRQANVVELIEAAARHGFPTITVAPHQYSAIRAAGYDDRALRRRLADGGVRVRMIDAVSAGLPGLPTEPIVLGTTTMERADAARCLDIAEALEAPLINVTHYIGARLPIPALADAVGGVCRQAAGRGVAVTLEFIPGSSMPTIADAHEVAMTCGEPNCGILIDIWHFARTGATLDDIRALPPGAINGFQLGDRIEPPPGTPYVPLSGRYLPGEGEQPLGEIVAASLANSPDITLEIEVFSDELLALSPDAAAARVASATKAWRDSLA